MKSDKQLRIVEAFDWRNYKINILIKCASHDTTVVLIF